MTELGTTITDPIGIKREAISHFQRFLQTQDPASGAVNLDYLCDLLPYRCPAVTAASLVAPISATKIKSALLSLPNDKVSGPDGYTKEFFVAVGL